MIAANEDISVDVNGEVVMNTNGDANNVHTQDNRGGSSYIFSQKSIVGVVEESFLE